MFINFVKYEFNIIYIEINIIEQRIFYPQILLIRLQLRVHVCYNRKNISRRTH
jgi:hypothetical protein